MAANYASGREGDWFVTGLAPRKSALTIYLPALDGQAERLAKLGKYTTGKSCIYVKRLSDIDLQVLADMARAAVRELKGGQ